MRSPIGAGTTGTVGPGHLLELAPRLPGIGPAVVAQGIANGVVGNGLSVKGGQLVLPVGIAVGVGRDLASGEAVGGGVGIASLAEDIAPLVVGVGEVLPRRGPRLVGDAAVLVVEPLFAGVPSLRKLYSAV